jgi:GTP-binding protein Era
VKAGFVSLIGRPNAGKSTLLNRLVGQKVAIVSDKPQTTRHRIIGVRHTASAQMVFIDTPGIHKPVHRMNRLMVDAAVDTLRDVDVVVLVVDASIRSGPGDRFVLDLLARRSLKPILALNKIDRVDKPRLLPMMDRYAKEAALVAMVPISARSGDGVDRLEHEIAAALPEGEPLYPDDYFTDQTQRSLAAEMIREKVLTHTRDELPYTTAVVIDEWQESSPSQPVTRIFASILVDRESQRPIVLGSRGSMIKQIGTDARKDLEAMIGGPVFLDLHVKVRTDWRDDDRLLDELGLRKR